MTMKKSESARVLALVLIFIGSVCDKSNVEGYPMEVENATNMSSAEIPENTIFGPLGIQGLLLHGIVHDLMPNMMHETTEKNEEATIFCNHSFKSIDAAMVVKGKVILFVDKGDVIDGRYETKYPIPFLFFEGPEWIEAAVYSEKTNKAYLFKDTRIWGYSSPYMGTLHSYTYIANSNKHSYSPECAIWYPDRDIIYLLKKGYLYEFDPYSMNVVPGESKLRSPLHDLTCDAAISFNNKLYFIIENAVVEMPKYHGREKYYDQNEFFNKTCNILPNDRQFI